MGWRQAPTQLSRILGRKRAPARPDGSRCLDRPTLHHPAALRAWRWSRARTLCCGTPSHVDHLAGSGHSAQRTRRHRCRGDAASASTETGADSVGNGSHASDATAAATLHPSAPNDIGGIPGPRPRRPRLFLLRRNRSAPPAQPFGGSPSLADAAPPSETSDPAGSAQSGPISANAAPPAETLRAIEPDLSSPTVAESASTGTDPVTTQSTTPLAETGQVERGCGQGCQQHAARRGTGEPPAASEGPETSPSMARAEPPSSESCRHRTGSQALPPRNRTPGLNPRPRHRQSRDASAEDARTNLSSARHCGRAAPSRRRPKLPSSRAASSSRCSADSSPRRRAMPGALRRGAPRRNGDRGANWRDAKSLRWRCFLP